MDIAFITKLRQSIASFTVLALLSTFVGTAALAEGEWPFTDDEPADAEIAAAAMAAYDAGYMTGTGEGAFDAEGYFNRAQAAKVVVLAYLGEDQVMEADAAPFDDVALGEWYTDYVYTAKDFELVEGRTATTYEPARTLNMAETTTLIFRAMGVSADTTGEPSFTDTDSSDWWYDATATLYNWSVVEMDEFDPSAATPRGQVAVWVQRSTEPEYRAIEPVEGDDDDEPVSEEGSVLMVELSDDTPEADTVPSRATSVPVASWDFTASGGDVNIERLIVKKGGVSTLSSSALTIWNGTDRLSSESSINSSTDLATFNNLDVEVEEGETVTLTARLSLENLSASSEVLFELESVNGVDAGAAEVQGDFPVSGELFALSTVEVGEATVTRNGTITNPSVGENDVRLAQFKVAVDTNPGLVQQLNLYFDGGSINSDALENLELYVTGQSEPLASLDGVDANGLASFVLDQEFSEDADEERCDGEMGWCIADGSSRIFYVQGDLNTGRSSDTIKAYFDETFDVVVKDARQGYNMATDTGTLSSSDDSSTAADGSYNGTSCTTSSGNCSYSVVQGGDITISTDTVTDRNVAVDEEDVTVMNFTITAEAAATFKDFVIGLTATEPAAAAGLLSTSTANFTDIKVRALDGSFTYGPVDVTAFDSATVASGTTVDESNDTTIAYYRFTDDLALDAGDSVDFEMTLDIANNSSLANATFTPTLYIDSSYPEIKDSNNNTITNSDSVAPSSSITGDEFTIKANSLTIAADTGVGSKTVVIGANDVEFSGFSFTAGDAEDIEVTSLTLTGYIDSDASGALAEGKDTGNNVNFSEVVQSVNLYEGSVSEENQINSSAKAPTVTTGKVVFDNISWTIPAGETRTLITTGDISRNSSWDADIVRLDIETASTEVEASDENGDTVTATGDGVIGGTTIASGAAITVEDGGTLVADVASGSPQSEIVVATSTGNEFAELRFTAQYESYQITDLALRNDYDGTTVGSYDDNISALRIRYYTDEAQTEEATATCALTTSGLFSCSIPSASPIYVPDSELSGVVDYASVFVEADINDVTSSLADEGDKPAFTISLAGDFEATGIDSGKKIEEAGTNDLWFTDIASLTLTDTTLDLLAANDIDADDTTITLTNIGTKVTVGDFICIALDAGSTCASDVMYVSAVSTNSATVVRGVGTDSTSTAGTDPTVAGDNDSLLVYGTANATDEVMTTNYMQVQATDLDLVADASTQTGSPDTAEVIMDLTVTANSAKDAKIRLGLLEAADTDPTEVFANAPGTDVGTDTSTSVDGTSALLVVDEDATTGDNVAANDGFLYAASGEGVLDNYAYVSYWVWFQDTSGSTGLNAGDLHFVIDDDSTSLANGDEDVFSTGAIADETWTFVTTTLSSIDVADDFFGLRVTDISRVDDTDEIGLDRVVFYNDKFNVDLTLNENWGSTTPSLAYLQRTDAGGGSQTVTTYAYLTNPSGTTGAAQLLFVPTTAELTIDGADDFKVKFDTTAITENSDATESLTATIEFGNISTNGDIFWYDQASQVTFFGVESTDRATVVTRY